MKTNSLVILALLGKASSLNLKSNSVVNLKINGVVFADDFDNAGESLGQMGYDDSTKQLMQQAANEMSVIPQGLNQKNAKENTAQNIQNLSQGKEATARKQPPSELGFPLGPPSAGIDELGLPGKDSGAQKVKALGKAKAEASAKVVESKAKELEAGKKKEESAKQAVLNDEAEKEAAKKEAAAKGEEMAALSKEIAQKQASIIASAEEAKAKADAKEAADLTKKLEVEEAAAVASELANENSKKLKAKAEEIKNEDAEKSLNCKVNKFTGLCHNPDGTKYHPQGHRAMGVNEWVGTNSELSSKEQHHQKDGKKEKEYLKEHQKEKDFFDVLHDDKPQSESEEPTSQGFKQTVSNATDDNNEVNMQKEQGSGKKDKKHHHHHSNKAHKKHKKHHSKQEDSSPSNKANEEVKKEEIKK